MKIYFARKYQNPKTYELETASTLLTWLWVFLFGAAYFAWWRLWNHVLSYIGGVSALVAGAIIGTNTGLGALLSLVVVIVWLVYPFAVYRVWRKHYEERKWELVGREAGRRGSIQ